MNVATIGTGIIVDTFLSALKDVHGASCKAVYSRRYETAEPLANKYDIPKIYTNLENMYQDPDIDFVYVASPNSLHYRQALQALDHGKNVICEKPLTSTFKEAKHLMELAEEKKLMLFEAISNIYLPNIDIVRKSLNKLGSIKIIQGNYSQYSSRYTKLQEGETPNIFNPAFSGGALADLNIYNLHLVIYLFGLPEEIRYLANKHENGIDTSGIVTLKYPGFLAECVGSKDTDGKNGLLIQGEKGYLQIKGSTNKCSEVILNLGDEEISLNNQFNPNRLYYELEAFVKMYKEKNHSACYSLFGHSLNVMSSFELARKDAQIIFAADRHP